MNRRAVLAATVGAASTALAGCLDAGLSGGQPESTPTESPEPTEGAPRLVNTDFEVGRVECGNDYGGPYVEIEDGVVTVTGTLDGSNACYSAELVIREYDRADDELYARIESVAGEDDEACATCRVEVDYTARFTFEDGEPSNVRIDQRGVTTGSSSAGQSANETASGSGSDTPAETASDDGTSTPTAS